MSPGLDSQAGGSETAVNQVWPYWIFLSLRLMMRKPGRPGQGGGEVGDGPLEQGPDALSRFVVVQGSLDRRCRHAGYRPGGPAPAGRSCRRSGSSVRGWAGKLRARDRVGGGASQAVRAWASSPDGGGDECSGRGAVEVVSGVGPERHRGIADHAPGAVGGLGRAGGGRDRG